MKFVFRGAPFLAAFARSGPSTATTSREPEERFVLPARSHVCQKRANMGHPGRKISDPLWSYTSAKCGHPRDALHREKPRKAGRFSVVGESGGEDSRSTNLMDMKLEVLVIPVSDVDRAKEFYQKLGWRLDVTPPFVIQLTPPGSWCSVQFGKNFTSAAPGSAKAYLIVSDIVATRQQLISAGVEV